MKRAPCVAAFILGALAFFAADASTCGVSRATYLGLMERSVSAYSDDHLARYLADAEKRGVQEHGFPRLAANLGVLVANGRIPEKKVLLARMLTIACRDAAKGAMPRKGGGNEFSVRELALAVAALERAGTYPRAVSDRWRTALSSVIAAKSYATGQLPPGAPRANNWAVFGAASEQTRLAEDMGGDPAHVEKYVADQLRWFDANGMYRDPDQPAVYDFVTRLQFAALLFAGYDGPSRVRLEAQMERAAEPTLRMLSASGEIPYGGRSNQFLHNNTFCAALCEWYAAWFAKRGDRSRASAFRRAARRAVDALAPWLAESPVSHVKNRYPLGVGSGVDDGKGAIGCEPYAYFDKYMVTMGSWAMLAAHFVDEKIPAAADERTADVFVTTPDFHFVFLRAGDYSAQFDYNADTHYDCDGLGRLQRAGAPGALCLATPCPKNPSYRLETPNDEPLAIRPVGKAPFKLLSARTEGGAVLSDWQVGSAALASRLSSEGLVLSLSGKGAVALALPAFAFDGREETLIAAGEKTLTVAYRGWICRYETDGTIVDTKRTACNRNGRYRRFEVRGNSHLKVSVTLTPTIKGGCLTRFK